MNLPSDRKLTLEELRAWLDRKPERPPDERDGYEFEALEHPMPRRELLEAGHA